jgi:hypothetical protein
VVQIKAGQASYGANREGGLVLAGIEEGERAASEACIEDAVVLFKEGGRAEVVVVLVATATVMLVEETMSHLSTSVHMSCLCVNFY